MPNQSSISSIPSIIDEIQDGLKAGLRPKLTDEGTSGVYFLRGIEVGRPLAVFKPIDEEQFAPNNPRGFCGNFGDATFRLGVKSGEATIREIAAFLVDYQGFSGVPQTTLAQIKIEFFPNHSDQTND